MTIDKPVHGWELEDIAKAQGVAVEPGDALVVYSGREALQADHPDKYYGVPFGTPNPSGLGCTPPVPFCAIMTSRSSSGT